MNKTLRYTLAVLACVGCYIVCALLLAFTGIGGVIAIFITCFNIRRVWRAIAHYGEEEDREEEQPGEESLEQ